MSQTLVEKAGDHIAQSIHEASRVTSEAADAVAEGVNVARRAAKQGCEAAEDFVHDSTKRIQRNPLAAVAATLVAGLALGMLAGLSMRRR
jgi:ElaB/YqjD/DUF883 family membrane-anchored ribosome-binding protein